MVHRPHKSSMASAAFATAKGRASPEPKDLAGLVQIPLQVSPPNITVFKTVHTVSSDQHVVSLEVLSCVDKERTPDQFWELC